MRLFGHVAIVDDDASLRAALSRLLRAHGIDSVGYPSARAFLAALPAAMPACLILDVNMPQMTGPDLQRELLRLGIDIPTIVITAIDDAFVAAEAMSLGAKSFLTKPAPSQALMAAIDSATREPV
ncbi:response regulator [Bradyrhizobium diazoefficiens]|nr:response regulator [Bradyrhizobium diazoefficiens]MBR0776919.1 response regulator [Bradyrhizobium diazoefficiens]